MGGLKDLIYLINNKENHSSSPMLNIIFFKLTIQFEETQFLEWISVYFPDMNVTW